MAFPTFCVRWPQPTFDRASKQWTFVPPLSDRQFDLHRSRFAKSSPESVEHIRHRQWLSEFEAFRRDAMAAGHSVALTARDRPEDGLPGPLSSDLVYSVVAGSLVFMERFKAMETAAFRRSRTWGDFRRGAPALYDWATGLLEGDNGSAPWSLPADDSQMYPTDIPGYEDGDFPDFPGQLMLELIPASVQKEFGEVRKTESGGAILWLDPDQEPEILAALRHEGFLCLRDVGLIEAAFVGPAAAPAADRRAMRGGGPG